MLKNYNVNARSSDETRKYSIQLCFSDVNLYGFAPSDTLNMFILNTKKN